jgi:uncharacterized protein YjbJ (UPF0337 family)
MKSSTQGKAEGTAKDLRGRIKEGAGSLAGNERMKSEGRADQLEGKVQKKTGDIKKVFDR